MKFRKRPVVIEAVQYVEGGEPPNGVCFSDLGDYCLNVPHIHTLEGEMAVRPGDWVITGVRGEVYPCKPDIFEQTYEPA